MTRTRRWSGLVLSVAMIACGSGGGSGGATNPGTRDPSAQLTVDPGGTVQAQATVTDAGANLTLYAGTRIALLGSGDAASAPAAGAAVAVTFATESAGATLPAGVTRVTGFRIGLLVDGVRRDAVFWAAPATPSSDPVPGAVDAGIKVTVPVDPTAVASGSVAVLYDVTAGAPRRVATSPTREGVASGGASGVVRASIARAAATSQGQAAFNPGGTGSYAAGLTGGSGSGGSAPPGGYSNTYSVADPGCVTVGAAQVCGPSRVDRIEIVEESTAEILGSCSFGGADVATTGVLPPGYEFWCQRTQPVGGGTTTVTVSSPTVANVPWIHSYLVRISDGLPMWETYTQPGAQPDAYETKDRKFAGSKDLTFTTTAKKDYAWMKKHALQPILDAGYTAVVRRFQANSPSGFTAEIDVWDTLDGRYQLGEDVVKNAGWQARDHKGNRGTFEYVERPWHGTAKGTMTFPIVGGTVWEVTANVTFGEVNEGMTNDQFTTWDSTAGTATQTVYTVPAGACYGVPASFTDTYDIVKGDGYLFLFADTDPVQYSGSLDIHASSPQDRPYQECCPYRIAIGQPECTDEVLLQGAQQHQYWRTSSAETALAAELLQGTFSDQQGAFTTEWQFTRSP